MIGGFQNPFMPQYGVMQQPFQMQQAQPQQVIRVNGENGARSYQMGANSSAILLDESGLMVWLVTSDGAGYKTVTPYDITPHQAAKTPDYGDFETRLTRLEEIVNGNAAYSAAAGTKQSDPGEH